MWVVKVCERNDLITLSLLFFCFSALLIFTQKKCLQWRSESLYVWPRANNKDFNYTSKKENGQTFMKSVHSTFKTFYLGVFVGKISIKLEAVIIISHLSNLEFLLSGQHNTSYSKPENHIHRWSPDTAFWFAVIPFCTHIESLQTTNSLSPLLFK